MKSLFKWSILALLATTLGFVNVSAYANEKTQLNTKVLIVLTSHSKLGNTNQKTGFWLPELTHPYYEFEHAGYTIDLASPQGGMAPLDAKAFNEPDDYHQRFLEDATLMAKVMRTIPLANINPADYDAILFSGGSGPMWDFPDNTDINRIASAIYENDGIVSAVCHGTAALVNIKLSNGDLLIKGKEVAAFTREEEAGIGQLDIIPFLLEEKLVSQGAIHVYGKAWQENVVVQGRLITGQNPASAKKVAQEIIQQLNKQ